VSKGLDLEEMIKKALIDEFESAPHATFSKERVWDNIQKELSQKNKNKKYFHLITTIAASFAVFTSSIFYINEKGKENKDIAVVRTEETDKGELKEKIMEAEKIVGFDFKIPEYIPEGVVLSEVESRKGEIILYYKKEKEDRVVLKLSQRKKSEINMTANVTKEMNKNEEEIDIEISGTIDKDEMEKIRKTMR